jgi:hypothetical protein
VALPGEHRRDDARAQGGQVGECLGAENSRLRDVGDGQ